MSIQKLSTTTGAGVTAPSAGKWAQISGGTVTTYSTGGLTYEVHTFTATGDDTLTVLSSGVVDMLIVGGGGGGGKASSNGGGGGGGGGVLELVNTFLPSGSHTVTVGTGGAARYNGNGSRVGQYVSPGGGAGGNAYETTNIAPGGASGGGAGRSEQSTATPGTVLLGNAGGRNGGGTGSGGGGGAGAVGTIGSGTTGGAGGAGKASTLYDNTTRYYGGGGGGGGTSGTPAGGTGGGGNGSGSTTGSAGTANTGGGGGGGGGASGEGGAGGSGIVIVRTVISGTAAGVAASGGTETTFTGNGTIGVNGQNYKVHTFTSNGSLTVAAGGLVDVLIVGGGGAEGLNGSGYSGGGGGVAVEIDNMMLSPGTYAFTVGAARATTANTNNGLHGNPTTAFGITVPGGGGGTNSALHTGPKGGGFNEGGAGCTSATAQGAGVTSTISGASVEYGKGGAVAVHNTGNTGKGGGESGAVIIRYPI